MTSVYLSLGSNIALRLSTLNSALDALSLLSETSVKAVSSFYYLRFDKVMYFSDIDESEPLRPGVGVASAAFLAMTGTFIFGIFPSPIIEIAHKAVTSILILE